MFDGKEEGIWLTGYEAAAMEFSCGFMVDKKVKAEQIDKVGANFHLDTT